MALENLTSWNPGREEMHVCVSVSECVGERAGCLQEFLGVGRGEGV